MTTAVVSSSARIVFDHERDRASAGPSRSGALRYQPMGADKRAEETMAARIWEATYATGMTDAEVGAWVRENLDSGTPHEVFLAKWCHEGRAQLQTSATYAAAMMATRADPAVADDLHVPWKAFRIDVPAGVLRSDITEFRVIDVFISDDSGGGNDNHWLFLRGIALDGRRGDDRSVTRALGHRNLADLLFPDQASEDEELAFVSPSGSSVRVVDDEFKTRASLLARRLVAGLLFSIQYTNNFKERVYPSRSSTRGDRRGPPPHRVYVVGAPIDIDCRPSLHAYLGATRKGPPSVQVLVRGHYRRQVVGVGREGRKVIWVQPYWRGPEGAPILVHPIKVGR